VAEEINLTLEGLYDILRNEKSREELQELPGTFYLDVTSYLRQKKVLSQSKSDDDELFATSDKKKLDYEIRSTKRILKEIYEKREKKIIDIAMNKSRTRSDIIDTSSMLTEERVYYNKIVEIFDFQRKGVLLRLFKGELPTVLDPSSSKSIKRELQATIESKTADETTTENESKDTSKAIETSSKEQEAKTIIKDDKKVENLANKVLVKFLHPVPRFIWKDMKEYGPFEAGQEVDLFKEIGELLAKKGRAQVV